MNYNKFRRVKDSEGQELNLRSSNRPYSADEDPLVQKKNKRGAVAGISKMNKIVGTLQRTVNEAFDYAIPLMNLVDKTSDWADVFLMNNNEDTFEGDSDDFCSHSSDLEYYEDIYTRSQGNLLGVISIPTTSDEAKQALKKMGWTYEQGLSYTMCIDFDPFQGLTPQNKKSIDNATRYYKSHPVQDSKRRVKDAFDNNSVTETLTKDFKDALTDMKRQGYHDLKLEGKTFTITWDGRNVRLEENGKIMLQEKTLKYLYEAIAKKYASQLDTRNLGDSKRRVKDSEGQDPSSRSTNRPYSADEDVLTQKSQSRSRLAKGRGIDKATDTILSIIQGVEDIAAPLLDLVNPTKKNLSGICIINNDGTEWDLGWDYEELRSLVKEIYPISEDSLEGYVCIDVPNEARQALTKIGWYLDQGLSYMMALSFNPLEGLTQDKIKAIENAIRYFKSHPNHVKAADSAHRVKDDFEEGDNSYDFEFNESDAPEVNEDMEAPVPLNGDNDYDFSYMDDEPDGDRGLYAEDEPSVAERSGFEENDRSGAFEDSDYDTETPQPDDAFDTDTDSFLESISGAGAAAFDSKRSFRDTRFRKIRRY